MEVVSITDRCERLPAEEMAIAQTEGEALRCSFEEVMGLHRGLFAALEKNSSYRSSYSREIVIVLGDSRVMPKVGIGKVEANWVRGGSYDPIHQSWSNTFFETTANLVGYGFKHQLVDKPEVFGSRYPGRSTNEKLLELPYGRHWSPEKVADTKAKLDELLPKAKATHRLLLEAACDPELNPDYYKAARAYRDSLQVAA